MPPIISVVGNSGSGKTTLIEKLIGELKSKGYRVATIKNAPQGATVDQPEKDSWRHIQSGSEATALKTPERMVLIRPVAADITLDEMAQFFGEDYDIILTEGFKQDSAPKIEVHRQQSGPLLSGVKKRIAIATDEPLETEARQFALDDIKGLAELLVTGFIEPQRDQVSLYINNVPVTLGSFPNRIINNMLTAMAASLKGVGEIRSLAVFMKKRG